MGRHDGNFEPVLESSNRLKYESTRIRNRHYCSTNNPAYRALHVFLNEICCLGELSWQQAYGFIRNPNNRQEYILAFHHPLINQQLAPAAMKGDSGGPLSCYPQLRQYYRDQHKSVFGVSARGNEYLAGYPNSKDYYTRIATHIPWVQYTFQRLNHDDEILLDGRHATMGQFPYQVAIRENYRTLCTGTILSERWVISVKGVWRRTEGLLPAR